jgi:hypothetical protein
MFRLVLVKYVVNLSQQFMQFQSGNEPLNARKCSRWLLADNRFSRQMQSSTTSGRGTSECSDVIAGRPSIVLVALNSVIMGPLASVLLLTGLTFYNRAKLASSSASGQRNDARRQQSHVDRALEPAEMQFR